MTVCVVSICIDLCCVIPWSEEIKRQIKLSCIPVVEASQEPIFSVAACNRDVDARPTVQHTSFVPCSRRIFDELKRRLIVIRVWQSAFFSIHQRYAGYKGRNS